MVAAHVIIEHVAYVHVQGSLNMQLSDKATLIDCALKILLNKHAVLTCWADTGAGDVLAGELGFGVGAARKKGSTVFIVNQVSRASWSN